MNEIEVRDKKKVSNATLTSLIYITKLVILLACEKSVTTNIHTHIVITSRHQFI